MNSNEDNIKIFRNYLDDSYNENLKLIKKYMEKSMEYNVHDLTYIKEILEKSRIISSIKLLLAKIILQTNGEYVVSDKIMSIIKNTNSLKSFYIIKTDIKKEINNV